MSAAETKGLKFDSAETKFVAEIDTQQAICYRDLCRDLLPSAAAICAVSCCHLLPRSVPQAAAICCHLLLPSMP